jgi:hypothetical protein
MRRSGLVGAENKVLAASGCGCILSTLWLELFFEKEGTQSIPAFTGAFSLCNQPPFVLNRNAFNI